jgi:dihydrofolate reductase
MRKLSTSTIVSLDGVIGSPHTWAGEYFDAAAAASSLERLDACDAMLMGRRTYEIFSSFWPAGTDAYAQRMNDIRKYVFSSTLDDPKWTNTTVLGGDVVAAARKLKEQDGKDLIMYGHGRLGAALLAGGLIDELSLFVLPIFLGGANSLLHQPGERTSLTLVDTKPLPTGAVILSYRPGATG